MLKPKVGDTVIIKGVVSIVFSAQRAFSFETEKGEGAVGPLVFARIHEILPRSPQVGDTVVWDAGKFYGQSSVNGSTLIHIHQEEGDNRKWAVVAYKGDFPTSVPFEALRIKSECVD